MMTKKIILVHSFFVLIAVGVKYYGVQGPDLVWNMFLALVAYDFSVLVITLKNSIVRVLSGIGWFFFYPNTFYMLTDIVHMNFTDTVLWDKGSLILYTLYVASIMFGVLSGVQSVYYMLSLLKKSAIYPRLGLLGLLSVISSFAIHIGRYARLNFWDLVLHPNTVVHELLAVFKGDTLHFIVGFTFLQFLCLAFLDNDNHV